MTASTMPSLTERIAPYADAIVRDARDHVEVAGVLVAACDDLFATIIEGARSWDAHDACEEAFQVWLAWHVQGALAGEPSLRVV